MNAPNLHDYHLQYPNSVSVPTLTQTRGLDAVLQRIEAKRRRQQQRAERSQQWRSAMTALAQRLHLVPKPVPVPVTSQRQPRL